MITIKKILTDSKTYLLLYVLACIATLFAIRYGSSTMNIAIWIIRFGFLVLYYIISIKSKNINYLLIAILATLPMISLVFISNPESIYAITLLSISRLLMIKFTLTKTKVSYINWNTTSYVFLMFLGIGILLLYISYNSTPFYYMIVVSVILLIILLSISFINLLHTTKRGNIELFTAISLFVVSDMISNIQRLAEIDITSLILGSMFYNVAFFFITESDIKNKTK